MTGIPTQSEFRMCENKKDASRPWQNACHICKVSFNKRSQLEAHCYATGHQRFPRSDFSPVSLLHAPTGGYNLQVESATQNSTTQFTSNYSMNEAGGWWLARQQKWPINFTSVKLSTHGSTTGNATTPEQFCSYQASHHMIQPPLFNETTTTPTPTI